MGSVDRRPDTEAYDGGSSLLDVGLTAAQSIAALGVANPGAAAWYTIGELEGGEMGENASETEVRNEADEVVHIIDGDNDFEIGQTSLSTDDKTLSFLAYLASSGQMFPMRYPLPAGVDENGNRLYQLWYFPNAKVVKENWRMNVKAKEARKRPFKIKAYKQGTDPLYVVSTVRLDDQANWDEALDGALDTRFAAA